MGIGENNSQSLDMTNQILPFVCPQFSVIVEMTAHFFLFNNWIGIC